MTKDNIMKALSVLNARLDYTPGMDIHHRETGIWWWDAFRRFDSRFQAFVRGGLSHPTRKKKSGSFLTDAWNRCAYEVLRWLYDAESRWFSNRRYMVPGTGLRVRSRSEVIVAKALDEREIPYKYEDPVKVGGVHLLPDFHLLLFGTEGVDPYVEFWGFPPWAARYREVMKRKIELYRQHGMTVISLFPGDLKDIGRILPMKYQQATGKAMPDYSRKPRF